MAHSMDETDERQHFNWEENNNSAEDNPSSVASFSALSSFDYSERPRPCLEIEEIPSSRWLSNSFPRSEPDEISPEIPATATSPSVASPSGEVRNKPSSFRWSRFFSPRFGKDRLIVRPWPSFLQQDAEFSDFLKGIHRFTFEEIREATNHFEDRNIIGGGGSKVTYRGLLPRPNKMVAVKLFKNNANINNAKHWEELQTATYMSYHLRHRNITSFLGYSEHKQKFMLIYEYQPNGSLDRLLLNGGEKLLNWSMRYKICLEIANGLAYLHGKGLTHTNFNPSNILFDAEFVPKIDVFSILSPDKQFESFYYRDIENLIISNLTDRADVYTYGAVILDIVTGKTSSIRDSIDHVHQLHRTFKEQGNLLEFVDPRLGSAYSVEEALTLIKLFVLCTKNPSLLRPSIFKVLNILESGGIDHEEWQDDHDLCLKATTLRTSKTSVENHINLIKDKITKHEEELTKLYHELNALKIQHVDDEKKLEEIHKVISSDACEITQLSSLQIGTTRLEPQVGRDSQVGRDKLE